MLKNLVFFVVFLFLPYIKVKANHITELKKIAYHLKNSLGETTSESVFTTTNSVDNQILLDRDELEYRKVFYKNQELIKNNSVQMLERKSRYVYRSNYVELECISCYGAGITTYDDDCYSGTISKTEKCADAASCFIVIHPQYIKRGCTLPTARNRTFVCKCPLCNDKPSLDPTYYEYRTINDWKYDNERLARPVLNMDLLCKICETSGRNEAADNICKNGSKADYMLCGHRQFCYTNIDLQTDYVSRGCISTPVYNTMQLFCNLSMCNNKKFDNPSRSRRELTLKVIPVSKKTSSAIALCPHNITILMLYININIILNHK